jgi:hypothetical protein
VIVEVDGGIQNRSIEDIGQIRPFEAEKLIKEHSENMMY